MEDIIKEAQSVLNNGGNIIKTRDDRELILVDKDGKIQNLKFPVCSFGDILG